MVSNKTSNKNHKPWVATTNTPTRQKQIKERSQKQWLEHLSQYPATYANTTPNTET
nr:MAG TPA: hypothetical protein [Caudoviricetes sp.]